MSSSLFLMKAEPDIFLREAFRTPGPSFDESISSRVSCVRLRHHDNDRQLPSPPPPFTSAKLSGLIARKIRPDFET